jgi:hypothetical protein
MEQRELIQNALRKLGPERCEQALTAFATDADPQGWTACLLAMAYGPRGELEAAVYASELVGFRAAVARLLGLTEVEVETVARAYDDSLDDSVADESSSVLRQMVEAEASKARLQKREAECLT